jgi:coenzyme PQQ biosynthesis protein PqqD
MGPERALDLGETARAIVELCDGVRTEEEIALVLAQRFDAPAVKIQDDVARLLVELRARCLIEDT